MSTCPTCGTENAATAKFCPEKVGATALLAEADTILAAAS
jgi:zinc-ribbon domain